MRGYLKLIIGGIFLWGQTVPALADGDAFDFFQEEAVENLKVFIASKKDTAVRETPGIVTVVTQEEILNSGARDLTDVLTLLVPGFHFGSDVEGAVSIYTRGIWAEEGKILLLVDGLEMNERKFGTTQFGNHYNTDNIDRIEIIRGPGSVVYGGFAELSVINVITKGAKMNGAYVMGTNSQMSKTFSHRGVSAGFGKKSGDFSSSFTGTYTRGNRSQRDLINFVGDPQRLSNRLDLADGNLSFAYKGLSFRTIANHYDTTQIDLWGDTYKDGELKELFDTYVSELKYEHKVTPALVFTPRIEYKMDYPWALDVPNQASYHSHAERTLAGLTGQWDATQRINVLGGVEYSNSQVILPENRGPFEDTFRSGQDRLKADNFAGFAQVMANSDIVNVTLGSRYDRSNQYGSAFVPRIALTKVIDRFHFKTMASQSFRSPVGILPDRAPAGIDLDPEKATNYEIELGYKLTPSIWWVVNGYDVKINKPIIYGTDPVTGKGIYSNFGKIGTQGIESDFRIRQKYVDFTANYAYYDVTKNNVANYALPDHRDLLLGAPAHRVNAIASVRFNQKISFNPSASYFSKRYAFVRSGEGEQKYSPVTLYNANLRMKDIAWKGTEIDFGVRDIFNKGFDYLPGYNTGKGPIPGPSRAVVVKVGYSQPF
jgi:outer membrane cobalamin receptor